MAVQDLQRAETGAIQFAVPLLIALFGAGWVGKWLDAQRWPAIVAVFVLGYCEGPLKADRCAR